MNKYYTRGCPKGQILAERLAAHNFEFETIIDPQWLLDNGYGLMPVFEYEDGTKLTYDEMWAYLDSLEIGEAPTGDAESSVSLDVEELPLFSEQIVLEDRPIDSSLDDNSNVMFLDVETPTKQEAI